MREDLKKFLTDEILYGSNTDIGFEDDLIAEGLIDSLGILHLSSFIEDKYRVRLSADDITPDNFKTILSLEKMIARKRMV